MYVYVQTIEIKIGVIGVLFEIDTYECDLHGILCLNGTFTVV